MANLVILAKRILILLLLAAVVAGIGTYLLTPYSNTTIVQFELSSQSRGTSQLFWSKRQGSYTEEDSVSFSLKQGHHYYAVYIPLLRSIASLRFDPINGSEEIMLHSITVREDGGSIQLFDSTEQLETLIEPADASATLYVEEHGVRIKPNSGDPRLELDAGLLDAAPFLTPSKLLQFLCALIAAFTALALLALILRYLSQRRSHAWRASVAALVEMTCSLVVLVVALTYLSGWITTMSTSSLWTDEIYTIEHFSAKGPIVSLTDYHAANNHIFFNVVNSLIPGGDSYDPARARLISFLAVIGCIPVSLWFFWKRRWYFGGCLIVVALTNSWAHLMMMLEARGYGLLMFSGLLLTYSVYAYLSEKKISQLCGAILATVMGTLTIPTFGFFALPLLALLALLTREKRVVFSVGAGFLCVAAVYVPLIRTILQINANYTDEWGAEFGSLRAVSTTFRSYLIPDMPEWQVVLVGSAVVLTMVLPWERFKSLRQLTYWRPVAFGIVAFFMICLFLQTPALRTAAFMTVVVAALLVGVIWSLLQLPLLLYLRVFIVIALTVMIYRTFQDKEAVFERYYWPHENWKGTAELITQLFPAGEITIYNNFRSGLLSKYLPESYTITEQFSEQEFLERRQVAIDSNPWANEGRLEDLTIRSGVEHFKILQSRGGYQSVLFQREPDVGIPKYQVITGGGCTLCEPAEFPANLNRCLNYVIPVQLELDVSTLNPLYSVNIEGTGLVADHVAVVEAQHSESGEWEVMPLIPTTLYYETRKWERHPHAFKSLVSIHLPPGDYKNLRLTFSPAEFGRLYQVSTIWFQ